MKLHDDDLPMPISPSGKNGQNGHSVHNGDTNFHQSDKLSTLNSTLKSPVIQLKPVNKTAIDKTSQSNQQASAEIPEFQRVFSHLRKVSVPEKSKQGNVSASSTGNKNEIRIISLF